MAKVPELIVDGLKYYVEQGQPPGGYLRAMLASKPFEAIDYADASNRASVSELLFAIKKCPAECYGSSDKVDAWIRHHGLKGVV